jgi:hypothetical protein
MLVLWPILPVICWPLALLTLVLPLVGLQAALGHPDEADARAGRPEPRV